MRNTCIERRNISLLKDDMIRNPFEEKVVELVDVGVANMWGKFKNRVLTACDEVDWVCLCQSVLGGFGVPTQLALCVVVSIFNGKGDIRICCCYGAMKHFEHEMKEVEWMLE